MNKNRKKKKPIVVYRVLFAALHCIEETHCVGQCLSTDFGFFYNLSRDTAVYTHRNHNSIAVKQIFSTRIRRKCENDTKILSTGRVVVSEFPFIRHDCR